MSSKVVEADAGVHSLAMAVAVSFYPALWLVLLHHLIWMPFSLLRAGFYTVSCSTRKAYSSDDGISADSIYTERYMGLPSVNPGGYVNASISNVTGFENVDYLLAHGSGDDNVHFANSAHLLDMLTGAGVQGFRFRMFTDSDHSISRRGAYRQLHEYMTGFLIEKWGKGGTRHIYV